MISNIPQEDNLIIINKISIVIFCYTEGFKGESFWFRFNDLHIVGIE